MDHCFFSTRGSFVFSVKTGIVGVAKGMEEQLVKHMNGLRFIMVLISAPCSQYSAIIISGVIYPLMFESLLLDTDIKFCIELS